MQAQAPPPLPSPPPPSPERAASPSSASSPPISPPLTRADCVALERACHDLQQLAQGRRLQQKLLGHSSAAAAPALPRAQDAAAAAQLRDDFVCERVEQVALADKGRLALDDGGE